MIMSWKAYIWTTSICDVGVLSTSRFQFGLYLDGYRSVDGWAVLAQLIGSVACTATTVLTYKRTRRRFAQAKADATLPIWRPPSRDLSW